MPSIKPESAHVKALIDFIKSEGYKVYGPEKLTSYVFLTDGENHIGYAQLGPIGFQFSTVHKPNRETGTGFRVSSLEESLSYAPTWYKGSVPKYNSFEEFRKMNWQKLIQY